jgi:hypothetical protein
MPTPSIADSAKPPIPAAAAPQAPASRFGKRLASWKLWLPALLVALALIATALLIPAYRRLQALRYLDAHRRDYSYEFTPESEWITNWLGEHGRCLRSVQYIRSQRLLTRLCLSDEFLAHVHPLHEARLGFSEFRGTQDGLNHLRRFRELRQIEFHDSCDIDDAALASFFEARIPLTLVWMRGTQASTQTARALSEIPTLVNVDLDQTPMTDEGCRYLARLPNLQLLGLGETLVGDEGVAAFGAVPSLTYIDLGQTHVTDRGIEALSTSKSLLAIDLDDTHVTDETLRHLAKVETLHTIGVRHCRGITDVGIEHLRGHPKLNNLNLRGTSTTIASVASFALIPQLESLHVEETEFAFSAEIMDYFDIHPRDWVNYFRLRPDSIDSENAIRQAGGP